MPTNLALPAYTDFPSTAGSCPLGSFGLPLAGPYTDCRINSGWHGYDFLWAPGGRLIVACCPTAQDGDHGELWVALYDDAYPPNYVSHVVIETSKVWGCSLLQRPDGILDLWYLQSDAQSQPQHRFSRDGGTTWSAAEVHSAGIFDFDTTPGISTVPLLTGSSHSFHPLPAALLKDETLVMLMEGVYDDGGTPRKGAYLLVAKLAAGGERWEFTGKKILAGYDSAGVQHWTVGAKSFGTASNLQAMPDGSMMVFPGYAHLKAIKDDATCTVETWSGGGTESFPTSQFTSDGVPFLGRNPRTEADWRQGRRLSFVSALVGNAQPINPNERYWRWGQTEFSAASRWASTASAVYPPTSLGATGTDSDYDAGIRAVNGDTRELDGFDAFQDTIPLCKQRPDGRWEFLRVNHLAELEFARCSVMPNSNIAAWVGR